MNNPEMFQHEERCACCGGLVPDERGWIPNLDDPTDGECPGHLAPNASYALCGAFEYMAEELEG